MVISSQQRAELQRRIWQIANDVRGSVDGWDFKQYVLGTLFYRFISEDFTNYMESNDEGVHYAKMSDKAIPSRIIEDSIQSKGYFIYPSQLFINIVAKANTNDNLNTDLKAIFQSIESSANGYPSEKEIKGLFADFDTTSNRLGNTVAEKNKRLAAVLKGVADLNFGDFKDHHIDLFGDAYEYLISNYAANAGKSGGEFFTPQSVSKLIAQLALHKQDSVNKIYDPAAGSGSLLLRAKRQFDAHIIQEGFFGQEINHTTYNLARMNMFLHNINYDKFNIALGDTLIDPQFKDEKPFDAIVSNPPYSIKWIGSDDPTLINDERFAPAGVLAPKSKADFAFVLHALSYLSAKGRAAIVCFPGIFYRGGAEQKIRQYLIDNNYIETVISLAPNLFFGTSIAVNILVLSKHKSEYKTQFIDASKLFKKETNNNILMDEHIDQIIAAFDDKKDKDYFAKSVDNTKIAENGYNLSVNSYVETEDTREIIDIKKLNAEIKMTVEKIDHLRAEIDSIIAEIEARKKQYNYYRDQLLTFKEGEVEWKTLGEVAKIKNGKDWKKLGDGNIPVYGTGGIMGYVDTYIYNKPTVLLPRKGSITNIFYLESPFWNVDTIYYTVINDKQILPKFLYYYLKMIDLTKLDTGSGRPSLTQAVLNKICIPIPPLTEQERIVSVLDKFDTLTTSITEGLPKEIALRQQQYEYYRDQLLNFPKA